MRYGLTAHNVPGSIVKRLWITPTSFSEDMSYNQLRNFSAVSWDDATGGL